MEKEEKLKEICKDCGIQRRFHDPDNLLYHRTCKEFKETKKKMEKEEEICEYCGHSKRHHKYQSSVQSCDIKYCPCMKFKLKGDFGIGLFGELLPYGKPKFEIKETKK